MSQTYGEVRKQLTTTTKQLQKARQRVSTYRAKVLDHKRYLNTLINQHNRVLKEYEETLLAFRNHIWQLFFMDVYTKLKSKIRG